MSKSMTYLVTLSRYQRVTVEVEAESKADAENEAIREYEDGEIDEFDWTSKTYDVLRCAEKEGEPK